MLSAVILTKNEEYNLERCLKSLSFVDEIVVIDDLSEDKTVDIAEKYKAHVHQSNLDDDFAKQRNAGMQKATGDWVLFIDADEELTKELSLEIQKITSSSNCDSVAFYIKRRDFFWGTELKHGEVSTARKKGFIRLVKNEAGEWHGRVHEEFKTAGKTDTLHGYLNHYPHQTVKEFISHVNRYSTLRAQELLKQGKKPSFFQLITYPFGKFILTYFFKAGFLDGTAGFAYAFFMSFHSFLVRAKLFQYTTIDTQ